MLVFGVHVCERICITCTNLVGSFISPPSPPFLFVAL